MITKSKAIYRFLQFLLLNLKYSIFFAFSSKKYNAKQILSEFKKKIIERGIIIVAKPKGNLNIFYAGTNHSQDYSGFIQGLQKFGNVQTLYDENGEYGVLSPGRAYNPEAIRSNDRALLKQVEHYQKTVGIDIFLGQLLANYVSESTLIEIQKMGIPVLNISLDDMWLKNWGKANNYQLGAIGLKNGADLVLNSTPIVNKWYYKEGCLSMYSPMASSPEIFFPSKEKKYDVIFVGGKYGLREKLVATLKRRGINVTTFGPGWTNGSLNSTQMAEAFRKSKIILGIGYAGYNKRITTLKNRDFDAVLSGALYITTRNKALLNIYKENEEIICYKHPNDCANKILYYLEHSEERKKIAKAGFNKAIKNHTWEIRFENLFKGIGLLTEDK
ncbi:MAG: glycosyltransferase [Bacteroidetes bacterium]|nr:glycosyltransferase [Bacteroidota bacterium]